eukprot:GILI01002450.1.p1 GENE.GILI01002450.1~~GILI01002450.1.p1  ORF type:complete len:251 (+),score=51.69 GILI01002450.1:185-937(+)
MQATSALIPAPSLPATSTSAASAPPPTPIEHPTHHAVPGPAAAPGGPPSAPIIVQRHSPLAQFLNIAPHQLDVFSKVLDFVYIGSAVTAAQKDEMQRLGIGYIINVTGSSPNFFPNDFQYMNARLVDADHENIGKHFNAAFNFIEEGRRKGQSVMVHCAAGMSRSATLVIAYLMKHHGMTLKSAYNFTRTRRNVISPNPGFMRQLARLEKHLYGVITLDPVDYEKNRFTKKYWQPSSPISLAAYEASKNC